MHQPHSHAHSTESTSHAPGSLVRSGHPHNHGSEHSSLPRLVLVLALSATVMVAELIGSLISGSLTLLADAGHMFVDSFGLLIAVIAAKLMNRQASDRYTWGLARAEVISAALQASMLLVVCLVVTMEAISRFSNPPEVEAPLMAVFAAIGLAANILGILLLHSHQKDSLNTRAAFLEVLNDALGSLAVLLAAGITAATGWLAVDPIATLIVAALMAPRAIRILGHCLRILLEGTPDALDLTEVRGKILEHPHTIDVHDLHTSNISSSCIALTAHVTVERHCFSDGSAVKLLHDIQHTLGEEFAVSINHSTIQLDVAEHRDHEHLHH